MILIVYVISDLPVMTAVLQTAQLNVLYLNFNLNFYSQMVNVLKTAVIVTKDFQVPIVH